MRREIFDQKYINEMGNLNTYILFLICIVYLLLWKICFNVSTTNLSFVGLLVFSLLFKGRVTPAHFIWVWIADLFHVQKTQSPLCNTGRWLQSCITIVFKGEKMYCENNSSLLLCICTRENSHFKQPAWWYKKVDMTR